MTAGLPVGEGPSASFSFPAVPPGRYRVEVVQDRLCWEETSIEVDTSPVEGSLVPRDATGVTFVQKGYILRSTLSHDISLAITHQRTFIPLNPCASPIL